MTSPVDIPEKLLRALADRYALERELGRGGMATVYLARDLRHDRQVALKVLRPELAAVIGAERFLAEIKTTANLQHPHILPLHDSGEVNGTVFYVMPFVEGESLRDRLTREKQLPVADSVRIATGIAGALDYAHRRNVIHRDIKPENILLHDGQALVADFGIALAAATTGGTRMTETGMSLGTPHYMSPEQAMGERDLDGRTDVYALGCVTYEMLTGTPPFDGPTAQAIVAKVLSGQIEPVTALRRTVPAHVEAAVHTALEKLPADRFPTAGALAAALADPGYRGDGARRPVSPRRLRDNRPAMAMGVIALVALAGALTGWLTRPPPPEHRVSRFEITVPAMAITQAGPRLTLSPDGRAFAFIGPTEGDPYTLLVRRLERLDPITVAAPAFTPVISPDGGSIAYVSPTNELRVVPLAGGAARTLETGVSNSAGLDWSEDGYLYFVRDQAFVVMRVPAIGGPASRVVAPDTLSPESGYNNPAYVDALPAGKGVLVTFDRGPGEQSDVAAVDIASGRVTYLVKGFFGRYAAGYLVYVGPDGTLMAAPFDQRRLALTGPPRSTGILVLQDGEAAAAFALSEQGTLLYAPPAGGRSLLARVGRDGTEEIVDNELWRDINAVSLSPDGSRIAMSLTENGQGSVWRYNITQKTLSRLTFDGDLVFRPLWSADGSRIAYISDRASPTRNRAVWIQPADGSGTPEVLIAGDRYVQEVTWSADGRSIAYREGYSDGKTQRDIWVFRAGDDTTRRPFVATKADEQNPKLSPDGRWLMYTSDESGTDEIYVRPFPDGAGRWQISSDGGTQPLWRRDGRELFYRDRAGNMVAAPVLAGPGFATGAPRALFSTTRYLAEGNSTSYDVTPDGSRFLMILRPVGETLVLVTN